MFRILNLKTGKYSIGGTDPKFTKEGKYWKTRNTLLGHLAHFKSLVYNHTDDPPVYENCVIIEYEQPTIKQQHSIEDFIK